MPTLIMAITRSARYFERLLRSLNQLYRLGGPAAETALLLFDRNRMMIAHAQVEAETLLSLDPVRSTVCASFARGGAALISLLLHPRERLRWIETGIQSVEQSGDKATKARLLNDLGTSHFDLGEFGPAADCYQGSLDLCSNTNDSGCIEAAMGNLANLYLIEGKQRDAIELLEKVVLLSRENGNERGVAGALNSLGAAYKDIGEYSKSIEYHEQARSLHNKIGDHRGEGGALVNLGISHRKSGNPQRAIEYYEEALTMLRTVHDERGESDALWNMSLALYQIGRTEDAVGRARSALEIRERLEDSRAGKIRERLRGWSESR
jgi:tetratricopeptide (TPR) repeat protein